MAPVGACTALLAGQCGGESKKERRRVGLLEADLPELEGSHQGNPEDHPSAVQPGLLRKAMDALTFDL